MQCRAYQKHFTAYLEGDLERRQRDAVQRHIQGCAHCQADLRTLSQTAEWLRSAAEPVPVPPDVHESLLRKIRAIRQPMSRWERLRLGWRQANRREQVCTAGIGLAATVFLCTLGTVSLDRWHVPGEQLQMGGGYHAPAPVEQTRTETENSTTTTQRVPVASPNRQGTRIRCLTDTRVVAGRSTTIFLLVEPDRDLADASIFLSPAAGLKLGGHATLQNDGRYLLRHGALSGGTSAQWVPMVVVPSQDGTYTVRVMVQQGDHLVAQGIVPLVVSAPAP